MDTNTLYYGDNLEILRKYIPDDSIDLIYLDPPFNSNATYNVLFKEPSGQASQAQISAFGDTWHWGLESERALQEIAASEIAPAEVKEFMSVLPKLVGKRTDMAAYLTMMCIRLIELRRVLKQTGSLYLHCDPTASHYLKLLLDTIFGAGNFRNEIVWRRSPFVGSSKSRARFFPHNHDIILAYSKTESYVFNPITIPYTEEYKQRRFKNPDNDSKGAWQSVLLKTYSQATLDRLRSEGTLIEGGRKLRYKFYLKDSMGTRPQDDVWSDQETQQINPFAKERIGYQTQKPEGLIGRIVKASSNEGDIVLDPFCGCGTAVVVAEKLKRKWIGIDITHLAIGLMKWRLKNIVPFPSFKVVGEPEDLTGAIELARQDKYQFQWWAVHKVGGQPYGDKKKGADTGIDGYLYYMDEKDKIKKAIISVKGGGVSVAMVRDLGHVIEREKADIGVFITLEKPTRPMLEEAAMKGFYRSPLGRDYPRLQILTVEEILGGKTPDIPPWIAPITAPAPTKKTKGKTAKLL